MNPAVLQGDQVVGTCTVHFVPDPSTGSPVAAPPMPFSAPLNQQLALSVKIHGKPAAVQGSWGLNTPAHVGLHPSDPFAVANTQRGTVTVGSATVTFEGKAAAKTGAQCQMCAAMPGQLVGSAATVLIGG